MNGAEYIIKFLEHKKVDIIFGYPGGAVLTLYDALYKAIENNGRLRHILTRHEQGAIHAAEGYAQTTKKTGVVFATSGPGATNLVTGLADAMLDSVPVFAITGQVYAWDVGHDAFQEADMLGVTLSITKHNYLVRDIKDLAYTLESAWQIAQSGRKGPVLIDIPKNIFIEEMPDIDIDNIIYIPKKRKIINSFDEQKDRILNLLTHSFRPVILAGGGVTASDNAPELMQKFMQKYNIPCAMTLMGKSNVHISNPLALGMAGMHGLPAANSAIAQSDLIIAVGTRFSDRTVGNPKLFSQTKSIIHADIDIAEISKNVKAGVPVVTDSAEFFKSMLDLQIPENKATQWKEWHNEILNVGRDALGAPLINHHPVGRGFPDAPLTNQPTVGRGFPDAPLTDQPTVGDGVLDVPFPNQPNITLPNITLPNQPTVPPPNHPAAVAAPLQGGESGKLKIREVIRAVVGADSISAQEGAKIDFAPTVYVTDVGQHQMIAAQETKHKTPGTFITSGGLGTMGFGLPAAIGSAFGKSNGKVILFSGDGGIQMNIQELATVRKTPVPVKIFILDNNRLGMVRQWQKHFYGGRYSQSVLDDNPEFVKIAEAYGIKGVKITSGKDLTKTIESVLNSDETVLIHVLTDPEENVYPIIPAGKSNHEMLTLEESEKTGEVN